MQGCFEYSVSAARENGEGAGGSQGEPSGCDTSLIPGTERRGGRKVEWKHYRVFGKAVGRVHEPKIPIRWIFHLLEIGLPWYHCHAQSLTQSCLWEAWFWHKCAGRFQSTAAMTPGQSCCLREAHPLGNHAARELSRKREQRLQRVLLWVQSCLPNSSIEVLSPTISECDIIWK